MTVLFQQLELVLHGLFVCWPNTVAHFGIGHLNLGLALCSTLHFR